MQSPGHPCAEVSSCGAEHDHRSAGHVFAAVITNTLYDCSRTRVPHAESFSDDSSNENFSAGRSVTDDVSSDDLVFCNKPQIRLDE